MSGPLTNHAQRGLQQSSASCRAPHGLHEHPVEASWQEATRLGEAALPPPTDGPGLGSAITQKSPQRATSGAFPLPTPRSGQAGQARCASIRSCATAPAEAHKMAAGAGRAAHVTRAPAPSRGIAARGRRADLARAPNKALGKEGRGAL